MKKAVREYVKNNRDNEVSNILKESINSLREEGYEIEFGRIGEKTTYALIYTPDHEQEYVGYTYVRDTRYYNENTGKLKALNQALARRESLTAE